MPSTSTEADRELCPGAWVAPMPTDPRARALVERYEPTDDGVRARLIVATAHGTTEAVSEELRRMKIALAWAQTMIRVDGLALAEAPAYDLAEEEMRKTRATFDAAIDRHLAAMRDGRVPSELTPEDKQFYALVCRADQEKMVPKSGEQNV